MNFKSTREMHSTRRKASCKAPALGSPQKRRKVPSRRKALKQVVYTSTHTSWKSLFFFFLSNILSPPAAGLQPKHRAKLQRARGSLP